MVKTLSPTQLRKVNLLERVQWKHPGAEFIGMTEDDAKGTYIAWFNYAKPDTRGLTTGLMHEEVCPECKGILNFTEYSNHGYCANCHR